MTPSFLKSTFIAGSLLLAGSTSTLAQFTDKMTDNTTAIIERLSTTLTLSQDPQIAELSARLQQFQIERALLSQEGQENEAERTKLTQEIVDIQVAYMTLALAKFNPIVMQITLLEAKKDILRSKKYKKTLARSSKEKKSVVIVPAILGYDDKPLVWFYGSKDQLYHSLEVVPTGSSKKIILRNAANPTDPAINMTGESLSCDASIKVPSSSAYMKMTHYPQSNFSAFMGAASDMETLNRVQMNAIDKVVYELQK